MSFDADMGAIKINDMAKKYDVLSPDGFAIDACDVYDSIDDAKAALKEWVKRYKQQGYYSSNNGRIPLDELENWCDIVEINNESDED